MPAYGEIAGATSHSDMVAQFQGQHTAMRSLERSDSAPAVLIVGLLWNKITHVTYGEHIARYDGANHVPMLKVGGMHLRADGSVVAEGNLPMGVHKLTGLAAGSANGDSVRFEQVLLLAGGTMTGAIAMGNHKITGLAAPTVNGDAARFQDLWPTTAAMGISESDCQLAQASDDAGTFQECEGGKLGTFVPRSVDIHVKGDIVLQAGGATMVAGADAHFRAVRHNGDANPKVLGQIGAGGGQVTVEVEWKFTEPRGVWIRIKGTISGAYCNVNAPGAVSMWAMQGVGQ